MQSKFELDNNYRHVLTVLASRIRNRQAVDYEFRLFFVMLRDRLDNESLLRAVFHASAHEGFRGDLSKGKRVLRESIATAQIMLEAGRDGYNVEMIDRDVASYVMGWRSGEKKREFKECYSESGKIGKWVLRPGAQPPLDLFEEVFASIRSGMLSMEKIGNEIQSALDEVGAGEYLDLRTDLDVRREVCLALASTLNGVEIDVGLNSISFFDFVDYEEYLRLDVCVYSRRSRGLVSTGFINLGPNDGIIQNEYIGSCDAIIERIPTTPAMSLVRTPCGKARLIPSYILANHYLMQKIFQWPPQNPYIDPK